MSGFEFRDSGFEIRDSGFGFRDSGFGIRDSGFGIRDSGFGFRAQDFGFWVDLALLRHEHPQRQEISLVLLEARQHRHLGRGEVRLLQGSGFRV